MSVCTGVPAVPEGSPVYGYRTVARQWFLYEMELSPSTKNRQHYLISFRCFLYYKKIIHKRSSKQRYCLLTGSVTENVAKLTFASEHMQAAEYAHNFIVDSSLQTTSTVVEMSRCRSPFRSPPTRLMHRTSTPMRCRTVAVHRR